MGSTGSYRRAGQSRGVRLTRRGRMVIGGLVLVLLLGAFWLGTHQAGVASTTVGDVSRLRTAVVPADGTLWEIAAAADPDADPRVTVRKIMDLNGLVTPIVQPGERLRLPPPG